MVVVAEGVKSIFQLRHGIDDHAVFGKRDHLVLDGLQIAFDLGLFDIAHAYELIESLLAQGAAGLVEGHQGQDGKGDDPHRQKRCQ